MKILKIAMPATMLASVPKEYQAVALSAELNLATLAALGVTVKEQQLAQELCQKARLDVPIVLLTGEPKNDAANLAKAAKRYEEQNVPGFLRDLIAFAKERPISFTTPGHHNGQYYNLHPAGVVFKEFFGDNMLYADTSDTVARLGDTMTHQGTPLDAQQHAAKVYGADKVYFCTNGTTSANTICASALLGEGDLVLFDRNNHKSLYNSALIMNKATPVYVPTDRNALGLIGEMLPKYLNEDYLRKQIQKVAPDKATKKRPFRLAVLQLETYDGLFYSAKWILDKIGHLCDYVLFDCAWGGYEQFSPLLADLAALNKTYGPDDPGILVTQSIHKQQAGMGQASQILKKDAHLKGQKRYVDHKHFNNAYLKYVTSSYAYPLYASLTVNAYLVGSKANQTAWQELLELSIDWRKQLLQKSKLFVPFVPKEIDGTSWQQVSTAKLASDPTCWDFKPNQQWHGFKHIAPHQARLDPFKLTICTPGVDVVNEKYTTKGIPGPIVAQYLSENNILKGKDDLYSLLFLLTPGDTKQDLDVLLDALLRFEELYFKDAALSEVLPLLASQHAKRYQGYTIQQLCDEMHAFYSQNKTFRLQQRLFAKENMQDYVQTPAKADRAFMQNDSELCALEDVVGRIALEGALPYPPGVFIVAPGERWQTIDQKYFQVLVGAMERFDGFVPEIQGVHYFTDATKKIHVQAEVLPLNLDK